MSTRIKDIAIKVMTVLPFGPLAFCKVMNLKKHHIEPLFNDPK